MGKGKRQLLLGFSFFVKAQLALQVVVIKRAKLPPICLLCLGNTLGSTTMCAP